MLLVAKISVFRRPALESSPLKSTLPSDADVIPRMGCGSPRLLGSHVRLLFTPGKQLQAPFGRDLSSRP